MLFISSLQNPRVKHVLSLQQKSRQRQKDGLFVVEGRREVERAVRSGYRAKELWSCNSKLISNDFYSDAEELIHCSDQVFEKICYRANNAEVLAILYSQEKSLLDLKVSDESLLVVLEGVEKPGNLGAIMRTCNGLGADAIIVCDTAVDIFNPNVIRNSLGAFFELPIFMASSEEAIGYLTKQNIQICTAHLEAAKEYFQVDYTKASALVFGSEAKGLTEDWVFSTNQNVIIPMNGIVDSLNVSVSVAIILSEAMRQRRV